MRRGGAAASCGGRAAACLQARQPIVGGVLSGLGGRAARRRGCISRRRRRALHPQGPTPPASPVGAPAASIVPPRRAGRGLDGGAQPRPRHRGGGVEQLVGACRCCVCLLACLMRCKCAIRKQWGRRRALPQVSPLPAALHHACRLPLPPRATPGRAGSHRQPGDQLAAPQAARPALTRTLVPVVGACPCGAAGSPHAAAARHCLTAPMTALPRHATGAPPLPGARMDNGGCTATRRQKRRQSSRARQRQSGGGARRRCVARGSRVKGFRGKRICSQGDRECQALVRGEGYSAATRRTGGQIVGAGAQVRPALSSGVTLLDTF